MAPPGGLSEARRTREEAVRRRSARRAQTVGLFDGSSLGKIEIHGPDALEFLDHFYINDLTTLKPHRVRYASCCGSPVHL